MAGRPNQYLPEIRIKEGTAAKSPVHEIHPSPLCLVSFEEKLRLALRKIMTCEVVQNLSVIHQLEAG